MLPSSLPLPHSWDFLLLALDKVGRFRVRFQLILSKCFLQNFTASSFRFLCFLSNSICSLLSTKLKTYCAKNPSSLLLDRYHKIGLLQPRLKVLYYNFFYCCSTAPVAIPGPGGQKIASLLTKSGHLACKIMIKREKILKIIEVTWRTKRAPSFYTSRTSRTNNAQGR